MSDVTFVAFDALVKKLFMQGLSTPEAGRLRGLLKEDVKYQERYKVLAQQWGKSHIPQFEAHRKRNYEQLLHHLGLRHPKKILQWSSWASRVAVGLLLMFTSSISIYYIYQQIELQKQFSRFAYIEAPLGSQSKAILPDSTLVWLNAGSQLKYASVFGSNMREVYLSGEAYFEVHKDARHPFVVHTSDLSVRVLGTKFDVSNYAESAEMEVNLIEGSVFAFDPNDGQTNATLIPNERLVFDKETKILHKTTANTQLSMQWTSGKLYFIRSSLLEIMKTVERKYKVQIKINSKQMQNEYFSGSVDANYSINQLLEFLDVDKKYVWKQTGNTITIDDKQ